MRRAVPAVAFEHVRQRMQHERQQDPLRLGRIQGPLERRLGGLRVPRAARGPPRRAPAPRPSPPSGAAPARTRRATGPRSVERPFAVVLGEGDDRAGDPHLRAVAVVLVDAVERRAGPPSRACVCSARARTAMPNACSPASSAAACSAATSARRASSGRPRASSSRPRAKWTISSLPGSPPGCSVRCARSSHCSASSRRPSQSRFSAPVARAVRSTGSSPSRAPPRSSPPARPVRGPPSRTARSTVPRSRGGRAGSPAATGARRGRPARPRARGARRASSRREDHSSATPRFSSAAALSASLSARSLTGCSGERRLRRPHRLQHPLQIAAPARQRQREHAPQQLEPHAPLGGHHIRQPVGGLDVRGAAGQLTVEQAHEREDERQLRVLRGGAGRRTRPGAGAPSRSGRRGSDRDGGRRARGSPAASHAPPGRAGSPRRRRPRARATRPPPGAARRRSSARSRRSSSCSRSANRWW